MSYHLYRSKAILLGGYPLGEDSKFLSFLTEEYGLITALAQGIRLLKSKLRYHTDPFSVNDIELVRGKDMWRCTTLTPIATKKVSSTARIFLTKIAIIIRRLVHGEEENKKLYRLLRELIEFLETRELTKEELVIVEIISLGNILESLGYFAPTEKEKGFLNTPLAGLSFEMDVTTRRDFISHINSALEVSHL